jgi:hypothetical protein
MLANLAKSLITNGANDNVGTTAARESSTTLEFFSVEVEMIASRSASSVGILA